MSAHKLNVLCVVADDQFRSLVGRVLRNAGFGVIEAATCAEAMQSAQNVSLNVAILDVNLPDGTGFELVKVWRASDQCSCPILFVSGWGHESWGAEIAKLNASFLTKPFAPAELLAAVDFLLKSKRYVRIEQG